MPEKTDSIGAGEAAQGPLAALAPLPPPPPPEPEQKSLLIAADGAGGDANPADRRRVQSWAIAVGAAILTMTAWRIAALYLTAVPLFFDEAQYWDWSRRLAFGYFSKPPLLAWLIAATTGLFGHTDAAVRLASPLMHGLAAGFIGLAGFHLGGGRARGARLGGLSALVYVTVPGVAVSSGIISTDAPLLACWAAALYALWRALESDQRQWWLATGTAIGLGLMAKYIMALFPLAAVIFIAATPTRRKRFRLAGPLASLALAVLIVAPNLVWNAYNGFATFSHTAANANLGGKLFNPAKMAEFVGAQFGVFGPITFAVLLGVLATARRWWHDERARYLMIFAATPLLIIVAQSFISRAHANWAAPTYVAASLLVVAWADRPDRANWRWRWIVPTSLALHLALQVPIAHFDPVMRAFHFDPSAKFDPFRRNRGWDDIGKAIEKRLAERPGAVLLTDDRMPLVEMLYYARAGRIVKWNPDGLRRDHYDLSTSMRDLVGRDVLLMTKTPGASDVRPYFDSVTPLGTVWSVTHPDSAIEYEIYWLKGYRGPASSNAQGPSNVRSP